MTTRHTRLKPSHLSTALLAALFISSAGAAYAQDAQNTDEESEAEQEQSSTSTRTASLDKVQVVGSRIKRAELETASPVQVFTREDIYQEGFQSVSDQLQTLTQGTSGANFTGDLNVSGFSPNAQVINLRQLGPGYTLTLINGRRPAQYPQPYNRDNNITNTRAIPTSIVERTEVLTGGASAIYGSDAVAGVVNIVTRKNFDGDQFRGRFGTTAEGGGDSFELEWTGGRNGERWNWLYALSYYDKEPIFAGQRHITSDFRNNPYGLTVNPTLSLAAWNVQSGRPIPLNHNVLYDAASCDRFGYSTVTTAARGTYCGAWDYSATRSLVNARTEYSAYTYFTFDISDSTQLFASAAYYQQDAIASGGTEFWATSGNRLNPNSAGAASPYIYEPTLGYFLQLQRTFNAFEIGDLEAASTIYDEKTYTVEAGLNGAWGRFDWEFSANYAEYHYSADRPRLLAQASTEYLLGPILGYQSGYPIRVINREHWFNPITPEIYRSISTRVINEGETSSGTLNFNVSGDLFELPAGPVGVAAVTEWSRQTVDLLSDWRLNQLLPPSETTIFNLVSSGETHGERDRYAAGLEFRIPVFSWLTTQLAARYDKYDDISAVDDAVTYNFGLEIRPFSNLLVRGNYATSFRAPDMQLVYAEGAASYSTVFDEYSCRSGSGLGNTGGPYTVAQCGAAPLNTIYNYSAQTRIAGNPGLEEEKGESWGYGFVWDIIDNMSLSVDYWDIKLEGRSVQLSAATILQREANCRLGVNRDGSPYEHALNSSFCQQHIDMITRASAPGTARDGAVDSLNAAYINAAYQRKTGVDAAFNYRWNTDNWGNFRANLGWSIRLSDEYAQNADTAIVDSRDDWSYDARSRARGSLAWNKGDWSASAFFIRYGSLLNWAETDRLAPYFVWNFGIGKKFGPNTTANFQVINAFDNQYRLDSTFTGYPYFYSYHGADLEGRRFFVTLTHTF